MRELWRCAGTASRPFVETEVARHANSDHERLPALFGTVRRDSIWQALRYRFVLRQVKREGLPAQSD